MVLNLEILQQFINRNSTNQGEHVVWNQSVQKSLTIKKLAKDVGLSKKHCHPYELFWIIANRKEMLPSTKLERTCQISNCVSHYNVIQYNLKSIVEMNVNTYIQTCERFDKNCNPKDCETGCINWNGYVNMSGYGTFKLFGKSRQSHCVAYILEHGEDIPEGLVVRHLCPQKNKLCVNPDHLTIGTHQQNAQDEVDSQHTLVGEKNPKAIISNQVAQMIINSFGNKKSVKERAIEFNVSSQIVSSIDTAKAWRSLMTSKQISERESVERIKRNNEILSDDIIFKIKNSKESQTKCAKTYNITTNVVQCIKSGNYKSASERDEIGFKKAIERLVKKSFTFKDTTTGIEHILFKNDTSQDPKAKRHKISYFGFSVEVHRASYMANNKIKSIEQGKVVRHKCLYKHCISNECLELGTVQDNANDRKRDNTNKKGELHPNATITKEIATQIKQTKGIGTRQQRSEFFNVAIHIITNIDCGSSWTHLEDDEIDKEVIEKLEEYVISQPITKKARVV